MSEPTNASNFDERITRLIERHEALTQTVEHLAIQGEEQRKRGIETDARIVGLGSRIGELTKVVEEDSVNIRALARIAGAHEQRIAELETGKGQ